MTEAQASVENPLSEAALERHTIKPLAMALEKPHKPRVSLFWRHYLQMAAAMVVGMIATGAIFDSIVGLKSWNQVTTQYPTQALLAMAIGMTTPMVAWMLFRGMGWRNSGEMATAMILPVIPFLCLVWFGVTKSAWCGPYCALTFVAMYVLMRYRASEYSMQMWHGQAKQ